MSYRDIINGYKVLVIGGAYSVDKFYRLEKGWTWFENEQLTAKEMAHIEQKHSGKTFDFILSHTCPISWQPRDLFLDGIDQNEVDTSMEVWMESFKNKIVFNTWLFGHYHIDRIQRPYVEILFNQIKSLDEIYQYWKAYKKE